jgi:hypothetical protein
MIEDWACEVFFCVLGILMILGIFAKASRSAGEPRRYRQLERKGHWHGTQPSRSSMEARN